MSDETPSSPRNPIVRCGARTLANEESMSHPFNPMSRVLGHQLAEEPGHGKPELVFQSVSGDPVGFPTIDDSGRVLATITTFMGELSAVPAGAGRRF